MAPNLALSVLTLSPSLSFIIHSFPICVPLVRCLLLLCDRLSVVPPSAVCRLFHKSLLYFPFLFPKLPIKFSLRYDNIICTFVVFLPSVWFQFLLKVRSFFTWPPRQSFLILLIINNNSFFFFAFFKIC